MRNYTAIIVDDQQASIDLLMEHFQKVEHVQVDNCFTDPFRALAYVRANPVDLVILDVDFGEKINGFDWIATVTKFKLKFILYTGFKQFEDEGYMRNVVDVLLKPVTYTRFVTAIHRLDADIRLEMPINQNGDSLGDAYDYFMVRTDGRYSRKKIVFKEIIYIQAKEGYVLFHLASDTQVYFSNSPFRNVSELLPKKWFKQCSRSVTFNIKFFHSFHKNKVRLNHVKNEISTGNIKKYDNFYKFLKHNFI